MKQKRRALFLHKETIVTCDESFEEIRKQRQKESMNVIVTTIILVYA